MALIRPVVLVFQEFATPTVTPATPDLNCLMVGPAYFIQDYFEPGSTTTYADKTDILLTSAYGTLHDAPAAATPVGADYITAANAPNNLTGALVDADSVVVYFDEARVDIANSSSNNSVSGACLATTAAITPNLVTFASGVINAGDWEVLPGDTLIIKDGTTTVVRTVYTVDSATTIHLTADLPASGWTWASTNTWRIERQVNDTAIASSFVGTNGNIITVDGGVTLTVTGQGAKTVTYAKVYVAYRSMRQDLTELDTVTSTAEILAGIGRLDARNPLASACFVALQNTTSAVQFVGVTSDDLAGHTLVRDAIASHPDVYAIVPLNPDPLIIAMWNTDCTGLAVADEVKGRPQRFRVVIGSGELPTSKAIIDPSASGQTVATTGTAPSTILQLTVPGATFIANGVIPGDILTIALDTGSPDLDGTYTVASVISNTVLTIDTGFSAADATLNVLTTFGITSADTLTARRAVAVAGSAASAAVSGTLYLTLTDASGSFVSSGVAAGDIIHIPSVATSTTFSDDTDQTFVVASIISENRLLIVDNGADTSTTQNELPHGVSRLGSVAVPSTATIEYKIVRTLSKNGQVTDLVAQSQSFVSRRTVLVWPDVVTVGGITGGTSQPGWYLAAAVGGMTAGLPPHQGFTFLGIAGISQIYHSNTYFNDTQLTDLSQGGWYVFAQQTPTTLPYTIHQMTTDVSTLESGEFSVVKNFDFVSLYFVGILEQFLGIYNITADTIVLIKAAMNIGGETLKMRTYAKIGAPLTAFNILDLTVSSVAADRLVSHVEIGLPKPLNNIELHLVA